MLQDQPTDRGGREREAARVGGTGQDRAGPDSDRYSNQCYVGWQVADGRWQPMLALAEEEEVEEGEGGGGRRENGEWRMENREWRMEMEIGDWNWRLENGERLLAAPTCSVVVLALRDRRWIEVVENKWNSGSGGTTRKSGGVQGASTLIPTGKMGGCRILGSTLGREGDGAWEQAWEWC